MTANVPPRTDFDSRWDYDRPEATEAEFRRLLAEEAPGWNPDLRAQLLTQIARAQGLQMKFDEASATLDRAEGMIGDDTPVARVRLLLERGRVLNSSRRGEEAKPLFRAAWEEARAAGAEGFAVDAAHMLAIVESGEASDAWNRRALELARASADPSARRWIGSLHNNLGWARHGSGDPAGALEHFREALAACETEGDPGRIRVARWCVARALRSLGRLEEALAAQLRLREEGAAAGAPDGYVDEEIGECLLALGRAEEARPHFADAHARLAADPWLARDEPARLERLARLGGGAAPAAAPGRAERA